MFIYYTTKEKLSQLIVAITVKKLWYDNKNPFPAPRDPVTYDRGTIKSRGQGIFPRSVLCGTPPEAFPDPRFLPDRKSVV